MKKEVLRTCLITKEKLNKNELLRVVRTPEGNVLFDNTGKVNGKGAYLKKDMSVINKAKKSNALGRILEVNIPDELYEILINEVEK